MIIVPATVPHPCPPQPIINVSLKQAAQGAVDRRFGGERLSLQFHPEMPANCLQGIPLSLVCHSVT
ncbi:hypothetical protein [Hyphomicrobium sulfonivorans]|uniref:hypothetical protein n=1 Tax=Hyphomicrobium sulfonivorans TaxID=121290 RepID=UPI000B1C165B|nr:hypothetical protein [Hyphomicrobium sulfonivorans]